MKILHTIFALTQVIKTSVLRGNHLTGGPGPLDRRTVREDSFGTFDQIIITVFNLFGL